MSEPHRPHAHAAGSGEDRTRWHDRLADALEPEMRHATDALLDAVRAGPGIRLLDLACGAGHTAAAASARGADVLGIDLAPAMVGAARRRFPGTRFEVGDMRHPPPGPWDAITCRMGAHHAGGAWARAAWRVLTPGGRLALAELEPSGPASWENGMRPVSAWVGLLQEAGFVDLAVTARTLRLGALAARDPRLVTGRRGRGDHLRDDPVFIVAGRRPSAPAGPPAFPPARSKPAAAAPRT